MAQHQQFDVFHMQATAAANKRTEQSPHSELEKREDHAADPPKPRPRRGDTNFGALHGVRPKFHGSILISIACRTRDRPPSLPLDTARSHGIPDPVRARRVCAGRSM
jgi:hypothetical protein